MAMVRACQTREEIAAFLAFLRAAAAYSKAHSLGHAPAASHRRLGVGSPAVSRRKRTPGKLGTVALIRNRFRVQVKLNGIIVTGPLRTAKADAHADMDLVRACQTREEMPAFLALLRAEAAYINARPSSNVLAAAQRRPEVGSPAFSRRKRGVDGASRPSGAEAGMAPAMLSPWTPVTVVSNRRRSPGARRRGEF